MSDFAGVGDGDLQAIVRGYTNGFSTTFMDNPPTCFAPLSIQEEDFVFTSSPDLFETTTVLDELEELYKPFYPILNPLSQQTVLSSSTSASREERGPEKVQEKESFSGSPVVAAATAPPALKYKRRKTQHKRVVLQVTAEGLSSDIWAWRKYGQKPIKGSPYPRSYYRCSSSKGCLARKQVERSYIDPEMFVITYTAEHCHGQPTRRNSLAGTTRNRFSPRKSSTTGDPDAPIPKDSSCSPISSAALSPPTPLLATIEDEFPKQALKKESTEGEEQQQIAEGNERNGLVICDMILSDDFLAGFDEFDGQTSDLVYNGAWWEQFPMSFPC